MATSTVTVSAAAASDNARQRWKIAALEQKLQVLEAGRMVKQRCVHLEVLLISSP
jgi:predicted transcriptional regulator